MLECRNPVAVAGERLLLLAESLIAERTDELSRHSIGYCGGPDQQAGAEHQGGSLEKNGGSSQAHLTDNMPILEHVSRAGAIPAKGEPL